MQAWLYHFTDVETEAVSDLPKVSQRGWSVVSSRSQVPDLWNLKPDDLRWSWCNNNRNKVHNTCNALEISPSHPLLLSRLVEKLSSMKLIPGAKKVGDLWSRAPWACVCVCVCVCVFSVAQLCLTLCDPMDCNSVPPGPSVHGILQARILEWVAMPSSRGSSWSRDQTHDHVGNQKQGIQVWVLTLSYSVNLPYKMLVSWTSHLPLPAQFFHLKEKVCC